MRLLDRRSTRPLVVASTLLLLGFFVSSSGFAQEPPPPEPIDSESSIPEPESVEDAESDDADESSESTSSADATSDGAPPPPPPLDEMDDKPDSSSTAHTSSASANVQTDTSEGSATPLQRVSLEYLGGLGGVVGGYLAGALGGAIVGALLDRQQSGFGALIGAVIGGAAGGYVGMPLGIWAVGNSVGGNGNFWATLGGTTLGLIATGLVAGAASNARNPDVFGAVYATTVLTVPFAGGIIGYELTHSVDERRNASSQPVKPGLRWSAGAGPTHNGKGGMFLFKASW